MEFIKLSKILNTTEFEFKKLDYLYLHHKEDYPLKNEMDIDNLFFVIEYSGFTVKVIAVLSGVEKEINFSNTYDNWWFFRIPDYYRNKILK